MLKSRPWPLLLSLATILLFPNNIQVFSKTHFVCVYICKWEEKKKKSNFGHTVHHSNNIIYFHVFKYKYLFICLYAKLITCNINDRLVYISMPSVIQLQIKKAIELLLFPVVVLCWQGQFYLPSAEIMEAFSYLCPPRRPLETLMSPEYLQFSLYELWNGEVWITEYFK